jgi:hypothetical protein
MVLLQKGVAMTRTMVAVLLLSAATSLPLAAQGSPAVVPGQAARMAAFVVADVSLADALRRIDSGSPSWRAALDSVAARGGTIIVAAVRELTGLPDRFARSELAAASPVVAPDSTVGTVLVVVNSALLERLYRAAAAPRAQRDDDLVRILVHEVYGHAVPYLLAGHVRGGCPDPAPGEFTGCAVDRENVVRTELGLGARHGHDLSGLALARYVVVQDPR